MEQILEKAKLTCASCGADMYIGLKEFVDASENPEMKAAILDGSFFLETCRECGVTAFIEYPVMYTDPEKKLTIYMAPNHEYDLLDQLNSLAVPEKDVDPEAVFRLVDSSGGLFEKILIFDHGRDDRVIEIYKVVLAGKVRDDWSSVSEDDLLYYAEPDEEGGRDKEFFIIWDEELTPGSEKLTVLMDDELYAKLAEDFACVLECEPNKYVQVDSSWANKRMEEEAMLREYAAFEGTAEI